MNSSNDTFDKSSNIDLAIDSFIKDLKITIEMLKVHENESFEKAIHDYMVIQNFIFAYRRNGIKLGKDNQPSKDNLLLLLEALSSIQSHFRDDVNKNFYSLIDIAPLAEHGLKLAPGKKPKKKHLRQSLADDWITRYREYRKHYAPHDATKEANQYIEKNWFVDRYGKKIGNQQVKKYVKERLKENEQTLN